MKLQELFEAVKEKHLGKQALEDYHTELTSLYAQMMLEMSELEKKEAMYFLENKEEKEEYWNGDKKVGERVINQKPDIEVKRMWRGTPNGQRLIELKNYEKATSKILTSLKNRMYSQY